MLLNKKDIKEISIGAIRCDGTINAVVYKTDGHSFDIYGLSPRQVKQLVSNKFRTLKIDAEFLSQTDEQRLKQNGVIL